MQRATAVHQVAQQLLNEFSTLEQKRQELYLFLRKTPEPFEVIFPKADTKNKRDRNEKARERHAKDVQHVLYQDQFLRTWQMKGSELCRHLSDTVTDGIRKNHLDPHTVYYIYQPFGNKARTYLLFVDEILIHLHGKCNKSLNTFRETIKYDKKHFDDFNRILNEFHFSFGKENKSS